MSLSGAEGARKFLVTFGPPLCPIPPRGGGGVHSTFLACKRRQAQTGRKYCKGCPCVKRAVSQVQTTDCVRDCSFSLLALSLLPLFLPFAFFTPLPLLIPISRFCHYGPQISTCLFGLHVFLGGGMALAWIKNCFRMSQTQYSLASSQPCWLAQ